jgi:hypothetical protein
LQNKNRDKMKNIHIDGMFGTKGCNSVCFIEKHFGERKEKHQKKYASQ